MDVTTILRYGTQVRLDSVDLYGFCGRDNHPHPEDEGFLGVVVGNFVERTTDDGVGLDLHENVLGGTEYPVEDRVDPEYTVYTFVCYRVRGADGRELHLMDHEIEAV